jgi:prepilin-type N-terminal cleavage/methylation domain-containing protein
MKSRQAGFTLVEIAIVLVIIGLLLGGVLKGQELINSAKVKNFATDFRNVPLFIYGYQDKYKALPGDHYRPRQSVDRPRRPFLAWEQSGNGPTTTVNLHATSKPASPNCARQRRY